MVPVDTTSDDAELRAAVHQLVDQAVQRARRRHGAVPAVQTEAWWDAPPDVQRAALLVLAEDWMLRSPDELAADQLKAAAVALSTGLDWAAAGHRAMFHSATVLARRRAEVGPLARAIDPAAVRRWVSTGSSAEEAS